MAWGITTAGFNRPRLEDIKAELEAEMKLVFGPAIKLIPQSNFGQLVAIMADREDKLWEGLEASYVSRAPSGATGEAVDKVLELSGLERLDAQKSVARSCYLLGTLGTVVPVNRQASVDGNASAKFENLDEVTLAAGTSEVQTISFAGTPASGTWTWSKFGFTASGLAHNISAATLEATIRALDEIFEDVTVTGSVAAGFVVTFLGILRKQPIGAAVVSSSLLTAGAVAVPVSVTETTPGVAQATVDFYALQAGPTEAPAFLLSVIATPVTGLDAIVNQTAAEIGRIEETDEDAKIRREQSLANPGLGTTDAIRAKLLQVDNVTAAYVFENDEDTTDGDGVPPHSLECVVQGGDDEDIAEALKTVKGGGIYLHGDELVAVIDSQGFPKNVRFSRPTEVPIYIDVDVLAFDADQWPDDAESAIKGALVEFGEGLGLGDDIIVYPQLVAALRDIPGLLDFTIQVGTAPAPSADDNIAITSRQIAVVTAANITVTGA